MSAGKFIHAVQMSGSLDLDYTVRRFIIVLSEPSGSPVLLVKSQDLYLHVTEKNLKLQLFKRELFTSIPKSTLPPSLPMSVNDMLIHCVAYAKNQ